jgi:hypothetical protein
LYTLASELPAGLVKLRNGPIMNYLACIIQDEGRGGEGGCCILRPHMN